MNSTKESGLRNETFKYNVRKIIIVNVEYRSKHYYNTCIKINTHILYTLILSRF